MTTPRSAGDGDAVVILGGSFDPVHVGHVAVLEQAMEALRIGRGWLLPTGQQPLRDAAAAGVEDRLAMVRAAVRNRPTIEVCDVEARRPGRSFTIDTCAELDVSHPATGRWWVLGADAARGIGLWKGADVLLAREHFAIVNRTGESDVSVDEAAAIGFQSASVRLLTVASPAVSATEVRRRLAAGDPVDTMLDPAVAEIIRARSLYGTGLRSRADNVLR